MKDSKIPDPSKSLWAVLGAFVATTIIYFGALWVITGAPDAQVPNPGLAEKMRTPLALVAVLEVGVIFVLRNITFFRPLRDGQISDRVDLRKRYFTASITSLSLAQAIVIYGFVLSYLSHDLVYYPCFALPGLLLMAWLRPQLKKVEAQFRPAGETVSAPVEDAFGAPGDHRW